MTYRGRIGTKFHHFLWSCHFTLFTSRTAIVDCSYSFHRQRKQIGTREEMKELLSRNSGSNSQQQTPIWIFLSLSILFTGLTIVGIVCVSSNERELNLYSTTEFIMQVPVSHNGRRLRSSKSKLRRRHKSDESDHIRPFILKDHRTDTQHLQEILYFLNHL